jgi:hypothetical protein
MSLFRLHCPSTVHTLLVHHPAHLLSDLCHDSINSTEGRPSQMKLWFPQRGQHPDATSLSFAMMKTLSPTVSTSQNPPTPILRRRGMALRVCKWGSKSSLSGLYLLTELDLPGQPPLSPFSLLPPVASFAVSARCAVRLD